MNQKEFIRDFARLGDLIQSHFSGKKIVPELDKAIHQSIQVNPWFTSYHIKKRLTSIACDYLPPQQLETWLSSYPHIEYTYKKEITVVMAGNIPLVGFHDYLSVLASGKRMAVKLSHKDAHLLPALHHLLCSFAPLWHARLRFVPEVPPDTDGLIVTGSDATAAWFTAHYPDLPRIVRGHRISAAVVPMEITQEQINDLHSDMFTFFGLGCRSVVRLFIPQGFDLFRIANVESLPEEASHAGFRNAYLRQKALLTLQERPFTDGGFFLLQPVDEWNPPVATVYYTCYSHIDEVHRSLATNASRLQCVVGTDADIKNCTTFGFAQNPRLWDYADGKDTMQL